MNADPRETKAHSRLQSSGRTLEKREANTAFTTERKGNVVVGSPHEGELGTESFSGPNSALLDKTPSRKLRESEVASPEGGGGGSLVAIQGDRVQMIGGHPVELLQAMPSLKAGKKLSIAKCNFFQGKESRRNRATSLLPRRRKGIWGGFKELGWDARGRDGTLWPGSNLE
jgi:hypothetical protein